MIERRLGYDKIEMFQLRHKVEEKTRILNIAVEQEENYLRERPLPERMTEEELEEYVQTKEMFRSQRKEAEREF